MKLEVDYDKGRYRELCESELSIPLYSQAWWLDAVAGKNGWGVVLVHNGSKVIGSLPIIQKHKLGFLIISQPTLTQSLGPWIRQSAAKYSKALGQEKDILIALEKGLPSSTAVYRQNWSPSRTNWLPFYWLGYEQTTRYTYRLNLRHGVDGLWEDMQENIRRECRKARERFFIEIRQARSVSEFYQINAKTFKRQGKQIPYKQEMVAAIYDAAAKRGQADLLIAADKSGNIHAGTFIVRDSQAAYYLMGGSDPKYRNSGAGSLVLWEAVCRQISHVDYFDFEGSMLEPVERFFRGFGASQIPYFQVQKFNSKLLKLAYCLKQGLSS